MQIPRVEVFAKKVGFLSKVMVQAEGNEIEFDRSRRIGKKSGYVVVVAQIVIIPPWVQGVE